MKGLLAAHLSSQGHAISDFGPESEEFVRYPLFAAKAVQSVKHGETDRAILLCGTGIGMSMVANKFKGIRASLCLDSYTAKMTRLHNDANVLCLGAKVIGDNLAREICTVWLSSPFEGGTHAVSLEIITDIENSLISENDWKPKN